MERVKRKRVLRVLAQATPPTTTSTNPSPTPIAQAITITLQQIPRFNTNLFSARPDIINDLNAIAGKINQYMQTLSANRVNFNIVHTAPSIGGSEFSNSLKNLTTLAKWLYSFVIAQRGPYSMPELRKMSSDFIGMLNSYTFPEPNIAAAKSDLVNLANTMLNKLPPK